MIEQRQLAPEFPGGMDWVNQAEPLRLQQLRGRIVLLHFWCASSVHSANQLAELKAIQARLHDAVTLVGVHCPRMDAERHGPAVLKAVNLLYIRHPVVNDPGFQIWRAYGVQAWPTVVVIDMLGRISRSYSGEGHGGEIELHVEQLIEEAGLHVERLYDLQLPCVRNEPRVPLRFPAKVLATPNAVYVSDSGHNRILEIGHDGRIQRQFGSGNPGFWDGRLTEAGLNHPTGCALFKDMLYVADTGNHAIRRIRLISGEIETIAGTGRCGRELPRPGTPPTGTDLNCPRDLALGGDQLYIAMAGMHQVWTLDLGHMTLQVLAGSGSPLLRDGDADFACMAQPNGLSLLREALYVVEGDSSALRRIDLGSGKVETLLGVDLFSFGDVDGDRKNARLQYPCGVCASPEGDAVWIADTYNSRLKIYDVRRREVRSVNFGYRMHEPTGLSIGAGALWVANTSAHEILRIDLAVGAVTHLTIGE